MTTPFIPDPSDTIATQMLKALRHAEAEGVVITALYLTEEDHDAFAPDRESGMPLEFNSVPVMVSTWSGYTTDTMSVRLWRGKLTRSHHAPWILPPPDAGATDWARTRAKIREQLSKEIKDITGIDRPLVFAETTPRAPLSLGPGRITWAGEEPKPKSRREDLERELRETAEQVEFLSQYLSTLATEIAEIWQKERDDDS